MANQIKTKYIEDGAVDGLKLLLKSDQTVRRLLEDGSEQDVIAYLENSITALQGAVLFEDDATVYADATAPIEDPTGRDGWYYKSAGSPDKVNWYFHDGQANPVTVAQWETLYTVATVDSSSNDTFHLAYYTFPLGDGQDAGSWYRSRIVYVPSGEFERGVKTLFYMGQEPDASVYPDLPRVQMTVTTVAGSSVGLNEDTEVIMTSVLGTNSAASAGTVEILVNKLGFNSSVYDKEYALEIRDGFTLTDLKQSLLEEATARQNADSALQSNIDSLDSSTSSEFATVKGELELIEGEITPYIYADEALPESSKILGWKYKKTNENVGVVGGRKINWYFFNDNTDHDPLLPPSDLGFEKGITIADLQAGQFSFSGIFEEMDNGQFLLQVYTKPRTGDTGWYHSKQTYSINPKDLGIEGMRKLFYIVNAPTSNPEGLDELEIPFASTAYHNGTQVQDVLGTDEIKLIAIGTNTIAPIGTEMYVDRVIVSMGAHSYNRRLTHESEAKVQGLLEDLSHVSSLLDLEEAARISGDAALSARVDVLEALDLAAEETARIAADSTLQSNIDVEKGRIDAILSASQADKDSFAEIVSLINSVDTANDQAFAGYVASNDAALATEVTDRTNADSALQDQINNLSGDLGTPEIEKFTLTAQNISDQYVDLAQDVDSSKYKRMQIFVGRLAMHLDDDFTLSSEGGVTRVTFAGSMASGGAEALAEGDVVYVRYVY